MKKRYVQIVAACFFICLFTVNGLHSFFPRLFSCKNFAVENFAGPDAEKKDSSEKQSDEQKEFPADDFYPAEMQCLHLPLLQNLKQYRDLVFKKDIPLSIITPPPEL